MKRLAGVVVALRVRINRRPRHRASGFPRRSTPGAYCSPASYSLVRPDRLRRQPRQVDVHDVVRMLRLKLSLPRFIEHVIRRRDHAGKIELGSGGVSNPCKRTNRGQDISPLKSQKDTFRRAIGNRWLCLSNSFCANVSERWRTFLNTGERREGNLRSSARCWRTCRKQSRPARRVSIASCLSLAVFPKRIFLHTFGHGVAPSTRSVSDLAFSCPAWVALNCAERSTQFLSTSPVTARLRCGGFARSIQISKRRDPVRFGAGIPGDVARNSRRKRNLLRWRTRGEENGTTPRPTKFRAVPLLVSPLLVSDNTSQNGQTFRRSATSVLPGSPRS